MNLLTIPFRNVRRRPAKTLLLLLVFTLGVISIVALYEVSRIVGHNLEKKLTSFGANIVIAPANEKLSVSYGGFHMGDMLFDIQELPEKETTQAIRSIELNDRISAVSPKLVTMERIGETGVAVVGVNWQQELGIKGYWAVDGGYPENSTQLLAGSRAAEKLGLTPGETIRIFNSDFTVSGVLYETGGDDDGVLIVGLPELQSLLGRPGATSFIEVAALCSGCPIEDIVAQLQQALPTVEVTALQHVVNQRMASIHFVQKLALTISMVILVTAATMVGLSMLSAVNERKKDIGILRSLGYGKKQIFLIFCIEAGLIGALAGCIGYLGGFGVSFQFLGFLEMAGGMVPIFSMLHMFVAIAVFGLITVLAAAYPSFKGASVEPSASLAAL